MLYEITSGPALRGHQFDSLADALAAITAQCPGPVRVRAEHEARLSAANRMAECVPVGWVYPHEGWAPTDAVASITMRSAH